MLLQQRQKPKLVTRTLTRFLELPPIPIITGREGIIERNLILTVTAT